MPPGQIRPPVRPPKRPPALGMAQGAPTMPLGKDGNARSQRITELLGKIRARRGGGEATASVGSRGHLNERGPKKILGKVTISPSVKRHIAAGLAQQGGRSY